MKPGSLQFKMLRCLSLAALTFIAVYCVEQYGFSATNYFTTQFGKTKVVCGLKKTKWIIGRLQKRRFVASTEVVRTLRRRVSATFDSTQKKRLQKSVRKEQNYSKQYSAICSLGPVGGAVPTNTPRPNISPTATARPGGPTPTRTPRGTPAPTRTPTPSPTYTPHPPSAYFNSDGSVTELGKSTFGIPAQYSANVADGNNIYLSYCLGCHVERTNYTFPVVRERIQMPPMSYTEAIISNQMLANLIAYLNRSR